MAKHIVIDPITRIEGHLRIEAVIDDNNRIVDAFSSSTMFRGIETILKGRDPRDCGLLAMRICGVCTVTHYQRSIEAVEHAFKITVPKNARIVRNLMQGALFLHDHLVHFYHLHSLDWIDITSALNADPQKAVVEAKKWASLLGETPWTDSATEFANVQERVRTFVNQGRLGIFGNGYWGNRSYKLTPEQNLIGIAHYLQALDLQRNVSKMIAIFGGKDPHPQSIVVGGVTCVDDIKSSARRALFKELHLEFRRFIKQAYLPDIYMISSAYGDEARAGVGAGLKNFLVYGGFRLDDNPMYNGELLFPGGLVLNGDLSSVIDFDPSKVTEDVTHAWYSGNSNLHPYDGVTEPNYTGFGRKENGIAYLDTAGKYSWIKSPLYDDTRVEVGPLARMAVGVARGDALISDYVTKFLTNSGLPTEALFSSVGRTAARAIETELLADVMVDWIDELSANVASGDIKTTTPFDFNRVSQNARGYGIEEAPRGALGHWVRIQNGKVANYQAVVPSTWNAAPRDYKERRGAYEESLIGLKVSDPDQPLEILRTVHSFDPCIACAVHIVDTKGKELGVYKVNVSC